MTSLCQIIKYPLLGPPDTTTMVLSNIILASAFVFLTWRLLGHFEDRQFWTLRLRVALAYEYVLIPYSLVVLFSVVTFSWETLATDVQQSQILWRASTLTAALMVFALVLRHLHESRAYRKLRWKAWTGPSRTGIPPVYTNYIGDGDDWLALEASVGKVTLHPVERFAKMATPFSKGIESDPTELLKARAMLDDDNESLWVPRSEERSSIYRPVLVNQSVSLLWGPKLRFRERCSRGIISVPQTLLTMNPKFNKGLDGRPICLAYAILARNKGPEPSSLVFNLETNKSFRSFEEGSVFWPRPSKTLRGYYRNVFERTFSLLGVSFVAAATELALLIADIPAEMLDDWLEGTMEQQDIDLNHRAAENGASSADLTRLYRGQYAAMLVSLSLHRRGLRKRPEILIYDAMCDRDHEERSPWSLKPNISLRRAEEHEIYGQGVQSLVQAVI